jgi:hypothetical protein
MRRDGNGLRWLGAALFCLAGCWTTKPEYRPPKHPEEFVAPPSGDARFSQPPAYPKQLLNNPDLFKKEPKALEGLPSKAPARIGAGGPGGGLGR